MEAPGQRRPWGLWSEGAWSVVGPAGPRKVWPGRKAVGPGTQPWVSLLKVAAPSTTECRELPA